MLTLSRTQKVDLRKISILHLAQQYLAFVEKARELRLELAADYLVMAAWLAFLKSRWLQAMRDAAARLMARAQLGRDFFARGIPEGLTRTRRVTYTATLLDLMQGYARIRTKDEFRPYAMDRDSIFSLEQALDRIRSLIGFSGGWTDIASFLPEGFGTDPARRRSAMASTFAATLELAKEGRVELRQADAFAPIHLRVKEKPRD